MLIDDKLFVKIGLCDYYSAGCWLSLYSTDFLMFYHFSAKFFSCLCENFADLLH